MEEFAMPSKFSFYITFQSMCCLFVASLFASVGIGSAMMHLLHMDIIVWNSFIHWIFVAARSALVLLIAVVPFRHHLDERPVLIWLVLGVSFAATAFPWIYMGEITWVMLWVISLMHVLAFVGWFALVFEDGLMDIIRRG